jgi:hypothetical protein
MGSEKRGCCLFGIAKLLAICVVFAIGLSFLITDRQEKVAAAKPSLERKMTLVEAYSEKVNGEFAVNRVELYAFDGELTESEIREFCTEKKKNNTTPKYFVCVVFDKQANVKRSTTPLTAIYGNQDDCMKHIRMIYFLNTYNGSSEVRWHPENVFEHVPNEIQI